MRNSPAVKHEFALFSSKGSNPLQAYLFMKKKIAGVKSEIKSMTEPRSVEIRLPLYNSTDSYKYLVSNSISNSFASFRRDSLSNYKWKNHERSICEEDDLMRKGKKNAYSNKVQRNVQAFAKPDIVEILRG